MIRTDIKSCREIPNVGEAIEQSFLILGLNDPQELAGKDPYEMYGELCSIAHKKYDPCVIDVFISAVSYMEGGPVRKWWEFTQERKRHLAGNQ